MADRLLHVDQFEEALDPGHLLALVGRDFLDKLDRHLVFTRSHCHVKKYDMTKRIYKTLANILK